MGRRSRTSGIGHGPSRSKTCSPPFGSVTVAAATRKWPSSTNAWVFRALQRSAFPSQRKEASVRAVADPPIAYTLVSDTICRLVDHLDREGVEPDRVEIREV